METDPLKDFYKIQMDRMQHFTNKDKPSLIQKIINAKKPFSKMLKDLIFFQPKYLFYLNLSNL